MATKKNSSAKSARNQAKAATKTAVSQLRNTQKNQRKQLQKQQQAQRAALKKQHEIERQRVKEFRKAGAALKRKKVQGFTQKDWRSAVPSAVFKKTGKFTTKAEKTIARLNDVIEGFAKLVTVKDKKRRDELKAAGAIVQGNKVQVQKDQFIPKKGKAEIKPERLGKVSRSIPIEDLEEGVRRYFDKHPGQLVGVQLGEGSYPLYQMFDDADSLIDYIETNFSSAIEKQAFDAIVLVPANELDKVRSKLQQRYRTQLKLGQRKKPGRKPSAEPERAKKLKKQADSRYYQRNKEAIKNKARNRYRGG